VIHLAKSWLPELRIGTGIRTGPERRTGKL